MEKTLLFTALTVVIVVLSFDRSVFVILTFDVEHDLPPILNSSMGLEAFSQVIDFLDSENVRATFFVTSGVADAFPELVSRIVSDGHELGGHSVVHSDYSLMSYNEVLSDVLNNILDLSVFGVVNGFKPPFNQPGDYFVSVLDSVGLRVDASHAGDYPFFENGILHVTSSPLFYPSSVYPRSWSEVFDETVLSQDGEIVGVVVVGMHPWEFVDLNVTGFEEYALSSGNYSWTGLGELVSHAKGAGARFVTVSEFYRIFK